MTYLHKKWTLRPNAGVNYSLQSTSPRRTRSFSFRFIRSVCHCVYPLTSCFLLHLGFLSDLHIEGLFRVPGHSLRQAALREMLNVGAEIDLETGDFHPNDAASLLKAYLGELPEPLLMHKHYHAHLKIGGAHLMSQN